jgi:DNA helicase-2/ATP-dependent DNA helicase PcrA
MVLYKLFLERFPDRQWKVTEGKFDYIQKNKYGDHKQFVVPIFAQDEAFVLKQLKDSYARIMNREFNTGCGKDDCHWCNFARRYTIVRPKEDELVEMDE